MSCISRAIRARSAAAPRRPSWSRSNSSRAARSCSVATSARRWQRDTVVHRQLGERYHEVSELAELLRRDVVRASSVVENVNSRLRNYLFLRKEVGQGSLELLRFYLNHHRFLRSERSEREGKSPAELLSGQEHGHWLEMLGYQLFHQSA